MKKFRESLPSLRLVVVTIIVCLVFGVLLKGFHPPALLVLLMGIMFLVLVTMRNYDPDAYDRMHNPREYRLRTERDELYKQLKSLTESIEEEGAVTYGQAEHTKARKLLDDIKARYKPKVKTK